MMNGGLRSGRFVRLPLVKPEGVMPYASEVWPNRAYGIDGLAADRHQYESTGLVEGFYRSKPHRYTFRAREKKIRPTHQTP